MQLARIPGVVNLSDAVAPRVPPTPPFQAAAARLLSGDELKALLTDFPESERVYCSSRCGSECLRHLAVSADKQSFYTLISKVAAQARTLEAGFYEDLGFDCRLDLPVLHLDCKGTPLTLSYAGSGHFGLVFRLKGGGDASYALKLFYRRNKDLCFSGAFSETALGIFITAHNVRDMPHLCAANPTGGWIITEFVHEDFRREAQCAPSWSDLGLRTLDEVDSNQLQTAWGERFRVDYGHLTDGSRADFEPKGAAEQVRSLRKARRYLSSEEFVSLFENNPAGRPFLCGQLRCVKPEERLEAVSQMLKFEEMKFFPVQDYLLSRLLPVSDTRCLFDLIMDSPDPLVRGQAVFDVRGLPEEDRLYLFETWRNRPEFAPLMTFLGDPESRRRWLSAIPREL